MHEKIYLIYYRNFKVIKDKQVFMFLIVLFVVVFFLFSLLIALFLRSYAMMILIITCLIQYNMPMFVKSILNWSSSHFFCQKNVAIKYIIFEIFKYNLLIVGYFTFLITQFIISFIRYDWLIILTLLLATLLNISIIINRFIAKRWLRVYALFIYLIVLLSTLWRVNCLIIAILLSGLILHLYLAIKNIQLTEVEYKNKLRIQQFNQKNKYFLFTYLFLRRSNKKIIYFNLLIVAVYLFFQSKAKMIIDYSLLLTIQYMIEVELIADYRFKHLAKTTSQYYIINLTQSSNVKKFMLSEYFIQFFIYSFITILAGLMSSYLIGAEMFLNALFTIPFLYVLGLIYFLGEKRAVVYRKKFNNMITQYFIFVVIILLYMLKGNWI